MNRFIVGVDVGGTKIKYALFNEKKIISKKSHDTNRNLKPEDFFEVIVNEIFKLLEDNNVEKNELLGVGMGLPSFVNFDEGLILMTSNLPLLKNFPARDYLTKRLNTKVVIDNDGNVAALAEHRHGAGLGQKNMIYCPVSTGVSSAIIINNKSYRGSFGWAGESGHTIITPNDGIMCGCQNEGCFMSHISGSMIVKRVIKKLEQGETSILQEYVNGDYSKLTANHILEGLKMEDELSIWAVEHMAYYMGMWLFNIYQILNINFFVFGGGLVNFGSALFDRAFEHFNELNHIKLPVEFKFAELGEDFGVIGAMELLLDELE